MIVQARARFPEAEMRSLSLPRGKGGLVTLRLRQPEEWVPGRRTVVWFDAADGHLVAARDARDLSRQPRAYNLLLALHAAGVDERHLYSDKASGGAGESRLCRKRQNGLS